MSASGPRPDPSSSGSAPPRPSGLASLFQTQGHTPRQATAMFRLMNPELFVQRTKKVSPAALLVSGMVGFVVITIGYTQYEYSTTTKKVEDETRRRKMEEKARRKGMIRREMEAQEGRR